MSPQFSKYEFNGFKINTENLADNCFLTKSRNIICIENITTTENGNIACVGRIFQKKSSFFKSPMNSMDLDIFTLTDLSPIQVYSLNEIDQKLFKMPMQRNKYLVVPLIHFDAEDNE